MANKRHNAKIRNTIMDSCVEYKPMDSRYSCKMFAYPSRCIPTNDCIKSITEEGRKQIALIERRFKISNLMQYGEQS